MADPIAENADFAVDELKRKARRRLVGAIVLALAAATVLPMLLEQEQKPLGEDVSVQIPPVDDGKFVNRLKGDTGEAKADAAASKAPGKADSGTITPAAAPLKAAPAAEPKSEAKVAAKAEPKADAKVETKSDPKAEAKPEPKPEAKPEAKPDPQPVAAAAAPPAVSAEKAGAADAKAATPDPKSAAAADTPKNGAYSVQLGAFTDTYGANALANRLKKQGYPAYTEPVETSRGTMYRVRVGGYPSREGAVEARNKLKVDGHNGIVAVAK